MRNYRQETSNPLPGFYRARVEDNLDSAKIGRVKVRIPQCHGIPTGGISDTSIKSKDLPWAFPCNPFGSGFDHGSFVVPEVGDMVWVGFEGGNPNSPVYFGGVYGMPNDEPSQYGNFLDEFKGDTYKQSEGKWFSESGKPNVPHDATRPSKKVLYKSPKGATILIDELDGGESFEIIDRLGQYLKFSCPVGEDNNSQNKSARRDKTVDSYDAKPLVKGESNIIIKDIGGQKLLFKNGKSIEASSKACKVSLEDNKVLIEASKFDLNTKVYINGELLEDMIARICRSTCNF